MAFPLGPTDGQIYANALGTQYQYNASHGTWNIVSSLATGPQGVTGLQGITGFIGSTGILGPTGIRGLTGLQGSTGFGIQGQTGVPGATGLQGSTGFVGRTGLQGVQGSTGIQGPAGVTGLVGQTGVQGIQGIDGDTGIQGIQGLVGSTGVQGIQGVTGIKGTDGQTGIQGIQGVTGLVGRTGIQGTQGIQGVTGLVGRTGIQGTQGTQGVTGLVGGTGIQGIDGDTGIQGLQGIDGDTGIQGVQGVDGDTGVQGLQGVTGLVGRTGIQGTQGIQGVTGLVGRTGLIGSTGFQGITGLFGRTGIQGVTGIGSAGMGGTGTSGSLLKFLNGPIGTVGDSIISDNTSYVSIAGNAIVGGNDNTTHYVSIQGYYSGGPDFTSNDSELRFRHGGFDRIKIVSDQVTAASNDFDLDFDFINAATTGYNTWFHIDGINGSIRFNGMSGIGNAVLSVDQSGNLYRSTGTGATGVSGPQGATGYGAGVTGVMGSTGPYGGPPGATGINGATGIQGVTGPIAATGALNFAMTSAIGTVPTGIMGQISLNNNMAFTNWTLLTDVTSNVSVTVYKCSYAGYPGSFTGLHGNTGLAITRSTKNQGDTSWWRGATGASGDVLKVMLMGSDASATEVMLNLAYTLF